MFTGEFNHTIDVKGRMIIPSKFRNLLGENFVISKSLDGCLSVYEKSQWDEVGQKLNELPLTNEKARNLKRFILGSSTICELDKQGRVLIPKPLREYADISQDVVTIGVGDHIEIWSKERFTTDENFNDYKKLAQDMEGLGI